MADCRVIDLKEELKFVEQYVRLRNDYTERLLTLPVNEVQTIEWFKNQDALIMGIEQDNVLLGVVILYLNRDGEVAFFVKHPNEGIGSRLLWVIEEIGRKKGLKSIWGWVLNDNSIAMRTFEKNGFLSFGMSKRKYNSITKCGTKYVKYF